MPHIVSSMEQLSALIQCLHEAPLDESGWGTALSAIDRAFQTRSATIFRQDSRAALVEWQSHAPGDAILHDYAAYYGGLDRLRPTVSRAPAGTVMTHDMVVPWNDFLRTEMYADFAAPHDAHHSMQGRVADGPDQAGTYFAVARSHRAGAFDDDDLSLAALLMPHLRTATRLRERFEAAGLRRDTAVAALNALRHAVFITDATARILLANRAAEALLRAADGIGSGPGGRLHAVRPGQTDALRRVIAAAATQGGRAGAIRLKCGEAGWLAVFASPLGEQGGWGTDREPAALLLIEQPQTPSPLDFGPLRALFGFTRAEAAVARRIAQGEGAEAAAKALNVAPTTLRWHLRRVFEKTDTQRQAELARLLARLEALAPAGVETPK